MNRPGEWENRGKEETIPVFALMTWVDEYSLLMHRIKIKRYFLWNEQSICGRIYLFQSALTLVVLQWHKILPDTGGTTIKVSAPSLPWSLASTPWAMRLQSNFMRYISGFQINVNDEIKPQYVTLYDSEAIGLCVKSWPCLMPKQNL